MAQRDDETELRPHETRVLCVNNCGFPGSPATNNMCQSCFQDAAAASARPCSAGSAPPIRLADPPGQSQDEKGETAAAAAAPRSATTVAAPPAAREVNRCLVCWKRVRLGGFRCRCGELFCGEHRYSDRHDCSFDYKAAAGAAIARANPIVRASKIARI